MSTKIQFNEAVYREFLEKHDLVYTVAPSNWENGVPMANSLVSAMVWGDDKLKVTIGRSDIWEMRRYHPEEGKFTWKYFVNQLETGNRNDDGFLQTHNAFGPTPQQLPLGRFEVETKGKTIREYSMRLHLYDAETTGYMATECGGYKWNCHVSALHPVVFFNYETFGDEELNIRFRFSSVLDEFKDEGSPKDNITRFKGLTRGYDRRNLPEVSHILRDWGYPDPELYEVENVHVYRQSIPENGNYSVAYLTVSISEKEKTLVVAIIADPENGKAEEEAVKTARSFADVRSLDSEAGEHRRWWHSYYPASFYSLSDAKLETLYWVNLYKLGCYSRMDGMAMPMSGFWTPDNSLAPWGNTYIWNTQQEMPFFPTYVGNRLKAQLPMYKLLIDHRDEMRKIGEDFFGIEGGEYLIHLTDYKLGCPYYTRDHFQSVSGPWMMQMMWNYYRFSMDEDFLREHVFSMMKAQARVLMGIMEKGEDQKLHFPWTMSAEYPPFGGHLKGKNSPERFGPDAASDLAYTKWICKTLLEAEKILGIKDEDSEKWQYTLDNIAPYTFDDLGGLMIRADMPLSDSHRHLSHLFAITQTHEITPDDPQGREIIRNSLHALQVSGTGEWMGWTFSETAKIAMLLNDREMAYSLIHEFADNFVNENTMDFDGSKDNRAFTYHVGLGLTIDSDGMFNDALQCFALSSYEGKNYIFTCIPREIKDISFYHFRAEGAFLVSGQRRKGKVEFISVEPQIGGAFCFTSELGDEVAITCDGKKIAFKKKDGMLEFDTEKGKEYIITSKGTEIGNAAVTPVERDRFEDNIYGLKY